MANPPYSIKQWNRDAWASDRYGRNIYGVPPQGRADYAFLQHIIASLDARTGRCAILFPHGVLFRDEEQKMREKWVAHDVIECVLGLGPNLFYNSPMEACIVVCRMKKRAERAGKVLFIDAIDQVTRERAQSFLEDRHIEKIVQAYAAFEHAEGFAKVATLDEIRANDANMSIARYVRKASNGVGAVALSSVLTEWQSSSFELRESMRQLFRTLEEADVGG